MIKIAVDAMGGDIGLESTLPGIVEFTYSYKSNDTEFVIYGNKSSIERYFLQTPCKCSYSIIDTGDKILSSDENPIHAIRNSHGTSMYESIKAVSDGVADAVVSSGNTGAYMVLSKLLVGTVDGILRPALVNVIPTKIGKTIMLDLGANTDCTADKLFQFAKMGKAIATILLHLENPVIGLLNIGTEKIKGTEMLGRTYDLISKDSSLNFKGFVEGNNITDGSVDVVVTDGFTGNAVLKSIEGSVKLVAEILKKEVKSGILSQISYFIGFRRVIKNVYKKFNPALYNGAPFVGLNKIVVKSHGSCNYIGFAHAIHTAAELVRNNFIESIKSSLGDLNGKFQL